MPRIYFILATLVLGAICNGAKGPSHKQASSSNAANQFGRPTWEELSMTQTMAPRKPAAKTNPSVQLEEGTAVQKGDLITMKPTKDTNRLSNGLISKPAVLEVTSVDQTQRNLKPNLGVAVPENDLRTAKPIKPEVGKTGKDSRDQATLVSNGAPFNPYSFQTFKPFKRQEAVKVTTTQDPLLATMSPKKLPVKQEVSLKSDSTPMEIEPKAPRLSIARGPAERKSEVPSINVQPVDDRPRLPDFSGDIDFQTMNPRKREISRPVDIFRFVPNLHPKLPDQDLQTMPIRKPMALQKKTSTEEIDEIMDRMAGMSIEDPTEDDLRTMKPKKPAGSIQAQLPRDALRGIIDLAVQNIAAGDMQTMKPRKPNTDNSGLGGIIEAASIPNFVLPPSFNTVVDPSIATTQISSFIKGLMSKQELLQVIFRTQTVTVMTLWKKIWTALIEGTVPSDVVASLTMFARSFERLVVTTKITVTVSATNEFDYLVSIDPASFRSLTDAWTTFYARIKGSCRKSKTKSCDEISQANTPMPAVWDLLCSLYGLKWSVHGRLAPRSVDNGPKNSELIKTLTDLMAAPTGFDYSITAHYFKIVLKLLIRILTVNEDRDLVFHVREFLAIFATLKGSLKLETTFVNGSFRHFYWATPAVLEKIRGMVTHIQTKIHAVAAKPGSPEPVTCSSLSEALYFWKKNIDIVFKLQGNGKFAEEASFAAHPEAKEELEREFRRREITVRIMPGDPRGKIGTIVEVAQQNPMARVIRVSPYLTAMIKVYRILWAIIQSGSDAIMDDLVGLADDFEALVVSTGVQNAKNPDPNSPPNSVVFFPKDRGQALGEKLVALYKKIEGIPQMDPQAKAMLPAIEELQATSTRIYVEKDTAFDALDPQFIVAVVPDLIWVEENKIFWKQVSKEAIFNTFTTDLETVPVIGIRSPRLMSRLRSLILNLGVWITSYFNHHDPIASEMTGAQEFGLNLIEVLKTAGEVPMLSGPDGFPIPGNYLTLKKRNVDLTINFLTAFSAVSERNFEGPMLEDVKMIKKFATDILQFFGRGQEVDESLMITETEEEAQAVEPRIQSPVNRPVILPSIVPEPERQELPEIRVRIGNLDRILEVPESEEQDSVKKEDLDESTSASEDSDDEIRPRPKRVRPVFKSGFPSENTRLQDMGSILASDSSTTQPNLPKAEKTSETNIKEQVPGNEKNIKPEERNPENKDNSESIPAITSSNIPKRRKIVRHVYVFEIEECADCKQDMPFWRELVVNYEQ